MRRNLGASSRTDPVITGEPQPVMRASTSLSTCCERSEENSARTRSLITSATESSRVRASLENTADSTSSPPIANATLGFTRPPVPSTRSALQPDVGHPFNESLLREDEHDDHR